MKKKSSAYAAAGVNIDQKMTAIRNIRQMIKATVTPGVLSEIGAFGGMFAAPGKGQVLVASTDGVGTKLKVAAMVGRHDTVGQDIVNHCVNDILVHGAKPLFFLDYFGVGRLQPHIFQQVVAGLCQACRENRCALIGGETAEMPNLYPAGEYDLVGTIVGVVDRKKIITGRDIRTGNILLGLPSSGLHTNGYSLARRVVFEQAGLKPNDKLPGTSQSIADALLAVHKSYLKPITHLLRLVTPHGLAHITGGGFPDNIKRILPANVDAIIKRSAWTVPPLFQFLQEKGQVQRTEMYRVFNMGIGMVIIVRPSDRQAALAALQAAGEKPLEIGEIIAGKGKVRITA